MVGDILVILVILVVRQMVAAAKLDGREAFLPMVAAAKFVVAMADGPSGACYGRRGWALRGMFFLVLGQRTGGQFFCFGDLWWVGSDPGEPLWDPGGPGDPWYPVRGLMWR